jgi:hypothetical protein
MEDLKDEQVDGGDWIKKSIPPGVAGSHARLADRCGCESGSQVVADPPQRAEE